MLNTLQILNVDIPLVDGDIGVAVSGGADSSLLLYLLLKHTKSKVHVFTLSKNTNYRVNASASRLVIEKCIQLTGNLNIVHHTTYAPEFSRDAFFNYPIDLLNTGKVQYVYTAVTANPPKSIADGFLGEDQNTEHSKRDPAIKHKVIDEKWITPFANIDKKKIAEMYKELGLLESLYPYTFSCENVLEVEQYTHCGECWWCKEREWGFNLGCK